MINNKKYRLTLIERYLDADTSVQEEMELAEYYLSHEIDEDEKAVAKLILVGYCDEAASSDRDSREFGRVMDSKPGKGRVWMWTSSIISIAAAVALVVLLRPSEKSDQPSPILDVIQSLTTMEEFGHVTGVESEQVGDMIFLTLTLDNGQQSSYMMMRNDTNGTLSYVPATKIE